MAGFGTRGTKRDVIVGRLVMRTKRRVGGPTKDVIVIGKDVIAFSKG
jgi:hypothetical protein